MKHRRIKTKTRVACIGSRGEIAFKSPTLSMHLLLKSWRDLAIMKSAVSGHQLSEEGVRLATKKVEPISDLLRSILQELTFIWPWTVPSAPLRRQLHNGLREGEFLSAYQLNAQIFYQSENLWLKTSNLATLHRLRPSARESLATKI